MTEYDDRSVDDLNSSTESKKVPNNEPNYMVPAAIIIAGIIIAIAIFASNGSESVNKNQDTPNPTTNTGNDLEGILQELNLSPDEVLTCADKGEFNDLIDTHISQAVTTGGQGTPWTVIYDRQSKNYYPLGGAYPLDQIISLIDSNFADFELTTDQRSALSSIGTDFSDDHYRGNPNARYVFVEFSDLDCPFCGQFHQTMIDLIAERDDIGWVYRHFPLEQLHPDARYVGNVSECAAQNGGDEAFWNFLDYYFSN